MHNTAKPDTIASSHDRRHRLENSTSLVTHHELVQYYGASKIRGVVAKTLGFFKFGAQGFQILTGPYFFV